MCQISFKILIYYKASHITAIFVSSGNSKDEEKENATQSQKCSKVCEIIADVM